MGIFKCPSCSHTHSTVVYTMAVADGTKVRRRRSCDKCDYRFPTVETVMLTPQDQEEEFDLRSKIYNTYSNLVDHINKLGELISSETDVINDINNDSTDNKAEEEKLDKMNGS